MAFSGLQNKLLMLIYRAYGNNEKMKTREIHCEDSFIHKSSSIMKTKTSFLGKTE